MSEVPSVARQVASGGAPHMRQFIGGRWVEAGNGRAFEIRDPWTGGVIGTAAAGDADDTRAAVEAAHQAFAAWSHSLPHERQQVFLRAADLLERRREEVVVLLAKEGDQGCSRLVADAGAQIGAVVANLCMVMNPEVVVVGGELAESGEVFLGPMRTAITRRMVVNRIAPLEVVPAALGTRAEVMGALLLALQAAEVPAMGEPDSEESAS